MAQVEILCHRHEDYTNGPHIVICSWQFLSRFRKRIKGSWQWSGGCPVHAGPHLGTERHGDDQKPTDGMAAQGNKLNTTCAPYHMESKNRQITAFTNFCQELRFGVSPPCQPYSAPPLAKKPSHLGLCSPVGNKRNLSCSFLHRCCGYFPRVPKLFLLRETYAPVYHGSIRTKDV